MRAILTMSVLALVLAASSAFASNDPVQANPNTGENFNRYAYANNNPYKFTDPDGRLPLVVPIFAGIYLYMTAEPANAPAPGERTENPMSGGEAAERFVNAMPAGKAATGIKMGVRSSKDGRGEHARERADQAKSDRNRNVGDANRVVSEGRAYRDTETGNTVHVKGDRVVVRSPNGEPVTQFKNPKANTQKRVESGRWEPIEKKK